VVAEYRKLPCPGEVHAEKDKIAYEEKRWSCHSGALDEIACRALEPTFCAIDGANNLVSLGARDMRLGIDSLLALLGSVDTTSLVLLLVHPRCKNKRQHTVLPRRQGIASRIGRAMRRTVLLLVS
jgi:hypothetical protein